MKTYSLWCDNDGDLTLVEGQWPPEFRPGAPQDAYHALVQMFEAKSWKDAISAVEAYLA